MNHPSQPQNVLGICIFFLVQSIAGANDVAAVAGHYNWTTDHMHVGVRWQPFVGRSGNNAYDARRPVIAEHSSYAQFWLSWAAAEPLPGNTDYARHLSSYLVAIEGAVDICVAEGIKVEMVFWHCPSWASVTGKRGAWRPKVDHYNAFVKRIATHFKGRVDAYQLYHEANLKGMMEDGDIDFLISEIFIKGARAIRDVYAAAPPSPVLISTSGCSPCEACPPLPGLKGRGAMAVEDYYRRLIGNKELMNLVDGLNMNVSDNFNGYGMMDGDIIPNVWTQYDLVRRQLDASQYISKKVLSSESWITWDDSKNSHDVNGDGTKDEKDAYDKAVTILGNLLGRGLNTINLPWSDNSSSWSMGLTKRRDYNGRIKKLKPEIVIPARGGGADIVTSKVALAGTDKNFNFHKEIGKEGNDFTVKDYIDPPDPNHLHYYVWRWYSQIAGGSDEVIRHAISGEPGNSIKAFGPGITGAEQYKVSSYNRLRKKFTVLLYSGGANAKSWARVSIPARIQRGRHYNNEFSTTNFRGEGFADGDKYQALVVTKNISRQNGSDQKVSVQKSKVMTVANGTLQATVGNIRKFTSIEFVKVE
jgi:hypothetical protein